MAPQLDPEEARQHVLTTLKMLFVNTNQMSIYDLEKGARETCEYPFPLLAQMLSCSGTAEMMKKVFGTLCDVRNNIVHVDKTQLFVSENERHIVSLSERTDPGAKSRGAAYRNRAPVMPPTRFVPPPPSLARAYTYTRNEPPPPPQRLCPSSRSSSVVSDRIIDDHPFILNDAPEFPDLNQQSDGSNSPTGSSEHNSECEDNQNFTFNPIEHLAAYVDNCKPYSYGLSEADLGEYEYGDYPVDDLFADEFDELLRSLQNVVPKQCKKVEYKYNGSEEIDRLCNVLGDLKGIDKEVSPNYNGPPYAYFADIIFDLYVLFYDKQVTSSESIYYLVYSLLSLKIVQKPGYDLPDIMRIIKALQDEDIALPIELDDGVPMYKIQINPNPAVNEDIWFEMLQKKLRLMMPVIPLVVSRAEEQKLVFFYISSTDFYFVKCISAVRIEAEIESQLRNLETLLDAEFVYPQMLCIYVDGNKRYRGQVLWIHGDGDKEKVRVELIDAGFFVTVSRKCLKALTVVELANFPRCAMPARLMRGIKAPKMKPDREFNRLVSDPITCFLTLQRNSMTAKPFVAVEELM